MQDISLAIGLIFAAMVVWFLAWLFAEMGDEQFPHDNMEDLNDEIKIRDDFNLAVKTKPTDENKT